jgi:hypothetical protein
VPAHTRRMGHNGLHAGGMHWGHNTPTGVGAKSFIRNFLENPGATRQNTGVSLCNTPRFAIAVLGLG